MATFAVIENYKVINKIIAESKIDAENVTQKNCVEIPEGQQCDIGWDYINSLFVEPLPLPQLAEGDSSVSG